VIIFISLVEQMMVVFKNMRKISSSNLFFERNYSMAFMREINFSIFAAKNYGRKMLIKFRIMSYEWRGNVKLISITSFAGSFGTDA